LLDWLENFKPDIVEREQARRIPLDPTDFDAMLSQMEEIFSPVLDGSVDPGDIDTIADRWWARYSAEEIEAAKKEVASHRKLASLYERLSDASPEEWEAYAQIRFRARFGQEAPLLEAVVGKQPT
jgi:hypothetical protein